MARTLTGLEDIANGDIGFQWYNKINSNNAKIETAFGGGLAEATHSHEISDVSELQSELDLKASTESLTSGLATKANSTHSHTGTDITVTHQSSSKTLQSALDTIQGYISGLAVTATITGISINGAGVSSSFLTASAILSAIAFGVFSAEYYFDQNEASNDFSTATKVSGSASQVIIPKPSDGWNESNQQYLHFRIMFTNMASTSTDWTVSNSLINKFSKDLTVEEIGDYLVGSTEIRNAIVRDLVGRKDFRSDIATQINSM